MGPRIASAAGLALSFFLASACSRNEGFVTLTAKGQQPRVDARADGAVAVVYAHGDTVYCRVSRDRGLTYDPPVAVATLPGLMVGMRRGPQVALTASGVVVTAIGKEGDLVAWRSADGGRNWKGPVTLSAPRGAAREGLHGLAGGAGEHVHAVWLEPDAKGTVIAGARSEDGGLRWTPRAVLYRSRSGSVCECCHPTIAADRRGRVAVMWRNHLEGARDMYFAASDDEGRTFSAAAKLGRGTWPLDACPMDGGDIDVSHADARVATIWRRDDAVYFAAPGEAETRVAQGRNPVVGFGPGGAFTAWQADDGIHLRTADGSSGARVVGRGAYPDLASAGDAGPTVLVWEAPGRRVAALSLGGN